MSILRAALRAIAAPARAFSSSSRPFKVLGVQQIAIGGESKTVTHLPLRLRLTLTPPCLSRDLFYTQLGDAEVVGRYARP